MRPSGMAAAGSWGERGCGRVHWLKADDSPEAGWCFPIFVSGQDLEL